jgi:hypothetical protein
MQVAGHFYAVASRIGAISPVRAPGSAVKHQTSELLDLEHLVFSEGERVIWIRVACDCIPDG